MKQLGVFGQRIHVFSDRSCNGTDEDGSDLDLLVDALPGATLFDLGALQVELEAMLGIQVDLVTPADLPPKFRAGTRRGAADMSRNRLADYLDHIQQAATEACSFVEGLDKDDFLKDKRTQQAVIMSLVIIGEAATKVMDGYSQFSENCLGVP